MLMIKSPIVIYSDRRVGGFIKWCLRMRSALNKYHISPNSRRYNGKSRGDIRDMRISRCKQGGWLSPRPATRNPEPSSGSRVIFERVVNLSSPRRPPDITIIAAAPRHSIEIVLVDKPHITIFSARQKEGWITKEVLGYWAKGKKLLCKMNSWVLGYNCWDARVGKACNLCK